MSLISCPECGKEISDMAKSCPNCGCPVMHGNSTISNMVTEVSCPSCGAENHPDADYCLNCDIRLAPYKVVPNNNPSESRNSSKNSKFIWVTAIILIAVFILFQQRDKGAEDVSAESSTEDTLAQTATEETVEPHVEEEVSQETIPMLEEFDNVNVDFTYKDIIRYPEQFVDRKIVLTAEVRQVMKGGFFDDGVYYRVSTDNDGTGYYYDDEYFIYDSREDEVKILENDVIKIYGTIIGLEELKRAITRTTEDFPSINMYYYELISE